MFSPVCGVCYSIPYLCNTLFINMEPYRHHFKYYISIANMISMVDIARMCCKILGFVVFYSFCIPLYMYVHHVFYTFLCNSVWYFMCMWYPQVSKSQIYSPHNILQHTSGNYAGTHVKVIINTSSKNMHILHYTVFLFFYCHITPLSLYPPYTQCCYAFCIIYPIRSWLSTALIRKRQKCFILLQHFIFYGMFHCSLYLFHYYWAVSLPIHFLDYSFVCSINLLCIRVVYIQPLCFIFMFSICFIHL